MKLYFTLILSFIITQTNFSQSGWKKQFGSTSENLNSVYFTNNEKGTIIGENGTILFTEDGGSNWVIKPSGTTNNLTSISFVDSNNGFIVGEGKTFLITGDGGKYWSNLSDKIPLSFASVSFKDSQYGFAVERVVYDSAKVFKTSDGGLNWNKISQINDKLFFPFLIKYLTNNIIIIAGDQVGSAVIYKSVNGGLTWILKYFSGRSNSGRGYNKTQFINSTTGFLLANHGMTSQYYADFYKTIDAGTIWIKFSNQNLGKCQSFYMIDEYIGFALGNSSIYKTENGGSKWQKLFNAKEQLNDVFFTNADNGIIVGNSGIILRTTTGGVKEELSKWEIQSSGITTNFKRVFLVNKNLGYCVSNELLKSTDIENNWFKTNFWMSGYLNDYDIDIWFSDEQNGIISAYIYIYLTTDGGNSWQETKTSDHLFGAFCTDNLHRIVVGWGGTIKYTLDSGNVWNSANSGTYNHLRDVYFVNKDIGYVVGDKGTILRTEDKGITWSALESLTTNQLSGVYFTNAEEGIAIGTNGTILKTENSGEAWEIRNSGTYSDLNSVFFKDKNNGIIVGELGVILRTIDGGENWHIEESGINNSLYGVGIKDSIELAVGDNGKILRNIFKKEITDTNTIIPTEYFLEQNYPNPFNPGTTIEYSIPQKSQVTIKVYDLLGREITTLINEEKPAGNYFVKFDGGSLTSGVYFYRLQSNSFSQTRKLLLLK
ncbi:MAG: YCF48-related protein [Melioribacteraceae bacterium]